MVNTKLIIIGVAIIILLGLISTIYIQNSKIEKQEIVIATCQDVNAKNKLSVEKMREDINKNSQLCGDRLKEKENTILKLKQIDNIKGETRDENSTSNPLLFALNSMFTSSNTN